VTVNAHATAPSEMTAHMYGCDKRCLVSELSISNVLGRTGECSNAPGASEGAGKRPAGADHDCKRYSSGGKARGREKAAKNAAFKLSLGMK
jgi:hypothetical protein